MIIIKCLLYRVLLAGGILSSLLLIINDILSPGFCPKIFSLPACYFVAIAFIFPFLLSFTHLRFSHIFSILSLSSGIIMGMYFSYRKLAGIGYCPLFFSIPLCYVSIIIFIILTLLQFKIHNENIICADSKPE